jgi:signal transduction histidine kinase
MVTHLAAWAFRLASTIVFLSCRWLVALSMRNPRLGAEWLAKRQETVCPMMSELDQKNQDLKQAVERAEALSKAKDAFIAHVSHELRTPLTAIKEGISLLLDQALGPIQETQRDFLKTMDQDIDRLTALINDMLDTAKIESGRMKLEFQRIHPTEVIDRTLRSLQPLLADRPVVKEIALVPSVFVDPNRLQQILTNFLSNAIKYSRPNTQITFIVEPEDGNVAIRVRDEGPGIREEDMPKLFQRFAQFGDGNQVKQASTGLGLALSKDLAELLGGRLTVTSQFGVGSTFSCLLPPYSDSLALKTSFREIAKDARDSDHGGVALVAIRPKGGSTTPQALEDLAKSIRRWLHRRDQILVLDSGWIVILAATDAHGLEAILARLKEKVPQLGESGWSYGTAIHQGDGKDGEALFEEAVRCVLEKETIQ